VLTDKKTQNIISSPTDNCEQKLHFLSVGNFMKIWMMVCRENGVIGILFDFFAIYGRKIK